jgi:hypothetical protein
MAVPKHIRNSTVRGTKFHHLVPVIHVHRRTCMQLFKCSAYENKSIPSVSAQLWTPVLHLCTFIILVQCTVPNKDEYYIAD